MTLPATYQPSPPLPRFDVFSRRGCHLCEVLIEELLQLLSGRAEIRVHDIDTDPERRERYDTRVPVVEYAGEAICEYRLDATKVLDLLRETGHRHA